MARCRECGTEQDTGRFCGHCGADVSASSPTEEDPGGQGIHHWEDHRPSPRRWTTGAVAAVLIAIVVATVFTSGDVAEPGLEQATPDVPTIPSPSRSPMPSAPPPLPVTSPGSCPDATPGCIAWHTDFPSTEGLTSPVAGTDPRHAYVGGSLPDGTGALYAIDPGNGIQLWRRRLPGPPLTPLVTPWRTVAVVYDHPGGGSGVREFDPETGEIRWQVEGVLSGQPTVAPTAAGSTLAVAGSGRMLLRHLDGNAVTIVEIDGSPTDLLGAGDGADGTFLVQTDLGRATAYAPDGSVRWSRTSTALGTAVSLGRTALLDHPGHIVGVDVHTGDEWRVRSDVAEVRPIVAGDAVVVVTRDGEIVRLSLDDGRELGRIRFEGITAPTPFAVDGDLAYVATCAGIAAYGLETGEEIWATGLDTPEGACADVPVISQGPDVELLVSIADRVYGSVPGPSVP